jgi:3',5'-cyclic AMP phosphodiesterase CpdA
MQTGDNTDNTQCNETRWMIDTFDGDQFIDPNSGIEGDIEAPGESELCDTTVGGIDPAPSDPPASPACNVPDNGSIYDGVRGDQEYYEPDLSDAEPESPPFTNASSVDGNGYSPYPQENLAEAGRNSEVRDFPGLYERMNHPFRAVGLDIPWYSVFGNHDALLQGNQPRRLEFETIALGCVKVKGPSAGTVAFIQERLADGEITPEEGDEILDQAMSEVGGSTQIVPPDPRRRPLRKSEYIAEHFATTGEPVGHGYTPENVATGMGNYAFDPLSDDPDNPSGLRFVALDSIAENGGDGGNIDREQFEWLHEQLVEADQERQVVVVFVHHSLRTMDQAGAHPVFTPGDQGGNQNPIVHQGLTAVPNLPLDTPPDPCPIKGTPPGNNVLPPPPGETLRCLLLRHKSVIALVNGHEHANRIDPWARDRDDPEEQENQADGGFWEINTAAHIDWPAQSRVLDLVDNGDCSLSIFTTMIDHAGAPMPGGAPPSDGHGHAGEAPTRMASIARELSFNDPDARNGQDDEPVQRGDARGDHDDRNAELVVKHPFEVCP